MSNSILADTTELRKMILKNPDMPIVVLVDEEVCTGDYCWTYAPNVGFRLDEILDCEQDIDECKVYHDRDELEDDIIDRFANVYPELSDSEFDEKVKEEMAKYEPYWRDCIMIWAGV